MPVRHEAQRPLAESKLIHGEPFLELGGVRVFLHKSEDDGELVVQIETPEDSDVHERMRVYMNDGEASGWR